MWGGKVNGDKDRFNKLTNKMGTVKERCEGG